MRELDVVVADGRTIHAYDTGGAGFPIVWHHGTPNIGSPPVPLFAPAERLGLRWLSYDRPGYGGSTPSPDRDVASAAADVAALADAVGAVRYGVIGHSGGGPHALASAALLPERVLAAVSISGLAPFDADGLDWFAGMAPAGVAALRAAAAGREAKERHEADPGDDDAGFTAADGEAIQGRWAWVLDVVRPALAAGPAPLIDDDLAFTRPWGFELPTAAPAVPALFVHGTDDRIVPPAHGEWLATRWPGAELRSIEGAGHVSVLDAAEGALAWLRERVD